MMNCLGGTDRWTDFGRFEVMVKPLIRITYQDQSGSLISLMGINPDWGNLLIHHDLLIKGPIRINKGSIRTNHSENHFKKLFTHCASPNRSLADFRCRNSALRLTGVRGCIEKSMLLTLCQEHRCGLINGLYIDGYSML